MTDHVQTDSRRSKGEVLSRTRPIDTLSAGIGPLSP
jgi:hypothetical protein